jgi:hypothetical protein
MTLGYVKIAEDVNGPIEGRSINRPMWLARPHRRGWAIPCPSNISRSGAVIKFFNAAKIAGPSRKANNPDTYGKVARLRAVEHSTVSNSGNLMVTATARDRSP